MRLAYNKWTLGDVKSMLFDDQQATGQHQFFEFNVSKLLEIFMVYGPHITNLYALALQIIKLRLSWSNCLFETPSIFDNSFSIVYFH